MAPTNSGPKAPDELKAIEEAIEKAEAEYSAASKATLTIEHATIVFMFGFFGAIGLALLTAAASTWEMPAARVGFGKGAMDLGAAALAAAILYIAVRLDELLDVVDQIQDTRDQLRGISLTLGPKDALEPSKRRQWVRRWAGRLLELMKAVTILCMCFFAVSGLWSVFEHALPCFDYSPPPECSRQDADLRGSFPARTTDQAPVDAP